MGIKKSEFKTDIISTEGGSPAPQPFYWDKKKKKILDMIINPEKDCTIKEIAEQLNMTPWKVSRFIRDKEFQSRYMDIVEANNAQLLGENKRLIQELMRQLREELKYKITKLDPDKLLKEYRLLLEGLSAPAKESAGPKIQQNIINPQMISEKVLKKIEDAVLKEQGFEPIEATFEEIKEARDGKSKPKKSTDN